MDYSNKTAFGLFKTSFDSAKPHLTKLFIGTLVYTFPLVMLALIPYIGWVLSVLIFGHLTYGYIGFIRDTLAGKEVKLYSIFQLRKNMSTSTFLGALLVVLIVLGSVLFIVPGLLVIAYYSMSMYVLQQDNSASIMENLRISSKLVDGQKVLMLTYKILFYILYAFLVLIAGIAGLFLNILYTTMPLLAVVLFILLAFVVYLLFVMVTVYFAVSNELFYSCVLKVKSPSKPSEQPVIEEAKAEETVTAPKTEKPVAPKQPAKPSSTKTATTKKPVEKPKTTVTKTVASKPKTTTIKPAAKKPTTTKK